MTISTKGTYYGQKKNEIHHGGFVISEYDYLEDSTPWHYHENPYFMYVLKGNMFNVNKKGKETCPSGSLVFHNWQEPHYNTKQSTFARGFHVEFERSWFAEKQLNIDLWEGSELLENPKLHHLLGQVYYEFKCNDASSLISLELLLLQLCENIDKRKKPKTLNEPCWIRDLKDLLNENTEDLSLTSLSTTLGVHPAHLSRSIPKYFSTTLGDYIRQQKVKKALVHLLDSNYSLTDISYMSGFADQSHFIRCFKRYMGTTPGKFRAKLGKG